MAILGIGLLGSSRNKVGNIVTYRMKGQDIARAKATQVSNPRTAAQQTQRVKLANLVAMYRANRPWMEKLAFEGKPQKWSTYNAFVSANVQGNEVFLTKTEAAQGCCVVAPYRVSEGSLPSVTIAETTSGTWATNLYCGEVNPATATIAELTEALLANNNGMAEGMQLSLIVNYQQQNNGVYYANVRYYELILDRTDTRPVSDVLGDTHLALVNGSIGFQAGSSDPVMGFTFVISQTLGGRTKVSTQSLVLTDTTTLNAFTNDTHQAQAVQSYGASNLSPFLASGYQQGSNADVEQPISILSVNNKVAGSYLGSGQTNSERFGINLSKEPNDVTAVGIYANDTWYRSTDNPAPITFEHTGSTISVLTSGMGSSNSSVISKIEVVADGETITIEFDNGGAGGGEVTE